MNAKCDDDLRIWLPADLKVRVRELAARDERKVSVYVRRVLELHVDTVEIHRRKVEGTFRPG